MQSVHRAHFLDELVKGVPAQRAHFNKRLQDLEETEDGVTLHFKDGTTATVDVAIGADGVHSTVRAFLIGAEAAKPVFSGAGVSRVLVPMNKAIEALGSEHAQNAVTLCGPGKLLQQAPNSMQADDEKGKATVSYPIDFGKSLYIAAFNFDHAEWKHEQWIVSADHKELTNSFKGWGKPAQDLLKVPRPRCSFVQLPDSSVLFSSSIFLPSPPGPSSTVPPPHSSTKAMWL